MQPGQQLRKHRKHRQHEKSQKQEVSRCRKLNWENAGIQAYFVPEAFMKGTEPYRIIVLMECSFREG